MASLLPPGFDPATGKLKLGGTTSPVITHKPAYGGGFASSYSGIRRSRSWWSRFNDAIIDAGNWFGDIIEPVRTVVMWIILGIVWISAIIGVISLFVQGRIFVGILSIIPGAAIVYYGSFIIAGLAYVLISVLLYPIRFIIWNAWTLIAAIVISIGIAIAISNADLTLYEKDDTIAEVEETYPTYVCTAWALNVRSAPHKSASILGALKKGDTCEVITFEGKFAKIKFGDTYGYVSTSYITEM